MYNNTFLLLLEEELNHLFMANVKNLNIDAHFQEVYAYFYFYIFGQGNKLLGGGGVYRSHHLCNIKVRINHS